MIWIHNSYSYLINLIALLNDNILKQFIFPCLINGIEDPIIHSPGKIKI